MQGREFHRMYVQARGQRDEHPAPEVETWVAAALAGAFGAFWLNRQIFGPKGRQPTE